ncbi:MAG: hypothetical protein Q4G70_08890 [Pseudomonadota bacterium]|nr:hypothetical protein [Pseudomonadota bacterium]
MKRALTSPWTLALGLCLVLLWCAGLWRWHYRGGSDTQALWDAAFDQRETQTVQLLTHAVDPSQPEVLWLQTSLHCFALRFHPETLRPDDVDAATWQTLRLRPNERITKVGIEFNSPLPSDGAFPSENKGGASTFTQTRLPATELPQLVERLGLNGAHYRMRAGVDGTPHWTPLQDPTAAPPPATGQVDVLLGRLYTAQVAPHALCDARLPQAVRYAPPLDMQVFTHRRGPWWRWLLAVLATPFTLLSDGAGAVLDWILGPLPVIR